MVQINQVTISGNLVADPEVGETKKGVPVCNFTIANNRTYRTDKGTQRITTYAPVSAFGATAENLGKYCQKGSPVIVMGELVLDSWESNGEKRQRLKIQANNVQFLPRGQRSEEEGEGGEEGAEQAEATGEGAIDDPING